MSTVRFTIPWAEVILRVLRDYHARGFTHAMVRRLAWHAAERYRLSESATVALVDEVDSWAVTP